MSLRAASFVATALLLAGPSLATPFISETVDQGAAGIEKMSLAIDSRNYPHIAYYDFSPADLKYATRRGATWVLETVDAVGVVGNYPAIAMDAQDGPHISYYDGTNGDLKYAHRTGSGWITETVDGAAANVGEYSSIALDAQGVVCISFYDVTNLDLKFARKESGVWTIETVDGGGAVNVGTYTSLALDAKGYQRISYYDATNGNLKFASKPGSGGFWTLEIVDATNIVGDYSSLELDAQGIPRISYHDLTNQDLRYASKLGGIWTNELVDGSPTTGLYSSLALDAQGDPLISYFDSGLGDLEFASKSGSTWTLESVDIIQTQGWWSSLALDRQGNPSIAYRNTTNGHLRFAESAVLLLSPLGGETWAAGSQQTVRWKGVGPVSILLSRDGGASYANLMTGVTANDVTLTVPDVTTGEARIRISRSSPFSTSDSPGDFTIAADLVSPWWSETVDYSVGAGEYGSLALDPNGRAVLAYYRSGPGDLMYGTRSGDFWTLETADGAALNSGNYNSLAIDELGNPHISTFDNDNLNLRYVTKSGGVWSADIVDAPGITGVFSSIALDRQGNPRISYWDQTNGELRYAEKNSGIWSLVTVDGVGVVDVGAYSSLELDSRAEPHIAYYSNTDGDLKYARRINGVWGTPEVVDGIGINAGPYASLELDQNDDPHIAYFRGDIGDLRYAVKRGGTWSIELVDETGTVGAHCALALSAAGEPHICYRDDGSQTLKFATRRAGLWRTETIDGVAGSGLWSSLALDAEGNAHVSTYNSALSHPYYVSSAVQLSEPSPGSTWPVGSTRAITWKGHGRVDVALSSDGGASWQTLASGVSGNEYRLVVPHTPTRFAQIRIARAVPPSTSVTPGLFTIQTSIALLSFAAQAAVAGGVDLSWRTDPGPADLSGYRLERERPEGGWSMLVSLTRATSHHDPDGGAGSRYRLNAVNGLGEELLLGEATLAPARPLAAWPVPYQGGEMIVSFATPGGLGGGRGPAEVCLYDLAGRLVRVIATGDFAAGYQLTRWDGRDSHGASVGVGLYYLRARSLGHDELMKVAVLR